MAALTVTPTLVVPSAAATLGRFICGATLTAGQAFYQDTDKSAKPASATGAAPIHQVKGIAATGAAPGQPFVGITADPALVIGATLTLGETLILSATAGGIAPDSDATTGWYKTILGEAVSTTAIDFAPFSGGVQQ